MGIKIARELKLEWLFPILRGIVPTSRETVMYLGMLKSRTGFSP